MGTDRNGLLLLLGALVFFFSASVEGKNKVLFVVSSRRVDCSRFNCDATDVLTSNLDNKDGRWMTVGVVLHLLLSFFEKRRAPAP